MLGFERAQRELAAHLRDPAQTPAPEGIEDRRLQIYRDLLFNNVAGLLANNFPVIKKILPADVWTGLVRAYYRKHAAHSPYFHQIAQEFMAFLSAHPETWTDFPFLLELAHYEWLELALDIDETTIDSALDRGDWMENPIVASPVARLVGYQYAVHRIRPGALPRQAPEQPSWLLVYRNRQDQVQFQELAPLAALLWQMLAESPRSGRNLVDALRQQVPALAASDVTKLIENWFDRGAVLGIASER